MTVKAEVNYRISRMIFKVAVELAMTMNIIAATNDIDETSLSRLRGECIKEVKKSWRMYQGSQKTQRNFDI